MTRYFSRLRLGLAPLLLAFAFLPLAAAQAQIRISESNVSEGDFVLGQQTATYSFTIEGTTPGTSRAEATVKPYWYIIYATGTDIYGNPFYQVLEQGLTQTLYGPTNPPDGARTEPTSQTLSGRWGTGDSTLLNYYPLRPVPTRYGAHRIALALYGDGNPATPPSEPPIDDIAFASPNPSRIAGAIYFYTNDGPDLAIDQVTYNAGSYTGGDIIRMTTKWRNNFFTLIPGEVYKIHNYLTENAAIEWRPPADPLNPDDTVRPDNDDFLLSEYLISGDRPVDPLDYTPITPDDQSIVRKVEVAPVAPIAAYGIPNRNPAAAAPYYGSTLRVYQPQPDDGYLDVGEVVSVTVEIKVPENYSGTYFVGGRVDPENTVPEPPNLIYVGSNLYLEIQDPASRRKDNNTFVSNASAKITIDGPTTSPSVEAVSSIAFEDGTYVQGGGETSNQSSVSADGNVIAFSSAARNLLVPPDIADIFIRVRGRGADMSLESNYPAVLASLGSVEYSQVLPYLTTGQQIFYRLRQTRENYLASGLAGIEANANCFNPSISSATGQYIAFDSRANNLGERNTGNRSLIYISDVQGQTIKAIRPDANGDCFNPSISANGRFVAFESLATNLDIAKPIPSSNTSQQIYLHDRDVDGAGPKNFDEPGNTATYLVSINGSGAVANATCLTPSLSAWEPARTGSDTMFVAYTSYASNLPGGGGGEQVYRVSVNVGSVSPGAGSVDLASVNNDGSAANKPSGAPNGSIEPSISGDGSQVAFSSSANNLVYNTSTGAYDGDTNFVPDVFVRDFTGLTTSRVSESIERVATGIISFVSPTPPPYRSNIDALVPPPPGNLSLVNLPENNPQPGDTVRITSGGVSETFVFGPAPNVPIGPDVPVGIPQPPEVPQIVLIGKDACTTRDNLVKAINASSLKIVAAATTPTAIPGATPPNMAISASIYLRSLVPGEIGNGSIVFTGVAPVITGINPEATGPNQTTIYFGGGGTQADDAPFLDPANPPAGPAVQGIPAGSNQPSISEDGRIVAFRSISYNLNVQALTLENDIPGGPPYTDLYPPSPRQGELLRPSMFPSSNVYVRNRAVDSSLASGAFDLPGNVATTKISANNFGYPTTISAQQSTGIGSWTTAANQAPAVGGNGRIISFSSGSEVYGGLVFGRNNLEPLDYQNARDVYVYDSQIVGQAPPPTESRPEVTLISPEDGLRVATGSTISLGANVVPKLGKSIASVQFYVNGAAVGAPLTSEPYAVNYKLANPGQYVVLVVAKDSRGVTGVDSAIVSAGPPVSGASPTVALTQPPSQVVSYVASSDLVFNAVANDVDGTVQSVTFYFGGNKLNGIKGFDGNWYVPFRPDVAGTFSLFAMAVDNNGNASVTEISTVTIYGIGASFPSVEIVQNNDGLPFVAGGTYPLRARLTASVPGLVFDQTNSGVLFYADGVYLGLGVLQADGTYLLNWSVPRTPRTYQKIEAYLSAPNRLISNDPLEYANCIVKAKDPSLEGPLPGPLTSEPRVLPSVSLIKPANSAQISAGVAALLEATASVTAGQGTIAQIEFYQNGVLIGTADNAFPYQAEFIPPSPGQYTLTALAYTTAGVINQSDAVVVNAVSGVAPDVAITSPSDGDEVTPGLPVTVTVNASDADGAVTSVELIVNGVVVGTSNQAPFIFTDGGLFVTGTNTTFTPTSEGVYKIVARARDNLGNVTDSDPVTVIGKTTTPVGRPPIVQVTQPVGEVYYVSGSSFFLNARATDTPPGQVDPDSVEFTVNGIPVTGVIGRIGNTYGVRYTPENLFGIDSIKAQATDNDGNTSISAANYTVLSVPFARLPEVEMLSLLPGASQDAGGTIKLRAIATIPPAFGSAFDEVNDQSRVEFYANGVYLGTATEVPDDPAAPAGWSLYTLDWISPSTPDAYVIEARVVSRNWTTNTGEGNVISYFSSVVSEDPLPVNTIPGTPPVVEITQPVDGADVRAGVAFTIQATASVPITEVTAPLPGAWAIATNNSVVPPRPYRAGDFLPAGTTVGTVTFPGLPALAITASGRIRTIVSNRNVTTGEVVATTGGGTIERVDFYANGSLVGTDNVAPYSASFTPPSPGPYTLFAQAFSTDGLVGISKPVSINSRLSEPPSVSIVSPPTGSTLSVNQPVTLVAQASDPDGSVVSVNFEVNGSPVAGSLSTFGAWTGTFTPTSGGTYTVVAIATDNSGNEKTSSPASVYTVSSTSTLAVDVTAPTEGQSFTLGTPVLLSATASTSPGTVTGLQFYVNYQPVGPLLTTAPYFFAYTPPSVGPYTVFAVATDSNGISKSSTPLRNFTVEDAPSTGVPTIFLSAPSNAFLVSGARVYLNFTVSTPQPDSIPASNVKIYIDGVPQTGVTKIGPAGDTFAVPWTVGTRSSYSIFATAQDSAGTTAFSGVTTIQTVAPGTSPPLVEILPYETSYPQLAVGAPVKLRARANFRNNTAPQFLEFYANGVLLGPGVPGTTSGGYTSYSLDWVPTVASSAVTFTARAVGSNAKVSSGTGTGTTTIDYFASAISSNSVNPPVTNIPILDVPDLTTGKQLNGQFVLWMFNQLLYRDPTYPEYFENLQLLGGNANGNASASVKADVVMNLMGYNVATSLFNQGTEYAQSSAIAFAPFGRLGLVPTSAGIINFISLTESDPSPLPLPGTYGGLTGAPWRATYGMARAMQSAIFDTPAFDQLYQGVSGLNGTPFVLWMTGSTTAPVTPAVMFPGRLTGGDSRVALANMIDDTPTLVSLDAASILQGAGAAFQSEYIAAALNSGLANNDPNGTEKTFQRRLQSAALAFQLGRNLQPDGSWTTDGTWNFSAAQLYSKEVVAGILVQNNYATAAAAPAAVSQTISFKLPSNLKVGRTYRLSARASSGMAPVTFALESSSGSRATLSGNSLTVTQPGVITVTASQAGGTKMPSAAAARRGASPVVYGPASATKAATAR